MGTSDFINALPEDPRQITAYDDAGFRIREEYYEGSLLIFGDHIRTWKNVYSQKDITPQSLDIFLKSEFKPELIIIGTGAYFTAPPTEIKQALKNQYIALEWMSTKAALTTWPILLADGRHVAGAFLPISWS